MGGSDRSDTYMLDTKSIKEKEGTCTMTQLLKHDLRYYLSCYSNQCQTLADKTIVSLITNFDLFLISFKMGDTEITLRENFGDYHQDPEKVKNQNKGTIY